MLNQAGFTGPAFRHHNSIVWVIEFGFLQDVQRPNREAHRFSSLPRSSLRGSPRLCSQCAAVRASGAASGCLGSQNASPGISTLPAVAARYGTEYRIQFPVAGPFEGGGAC